MGTETQDPGSQPKPIPPGVQPPDEGQDVPKTAADDVPGEDEGDEDETGKIELPGEIVEGDQRDPSSPAVNP